MISKNTVFSRNGNLLWWAACSMSCPCCCEGKNSDTSPTGSSWSLLLTLYNLPYLKRCWVQSHSADSGEPERHGRSCSHRWRLPANKRPPLDWLVNSASSASKTAFLLPSTLLPAQVKIPCITRSLSSTQAHRLFRHAPFAAGFSSYYINASPFPRHLLGSSRVALAASTITQTGTCDC